MIFWEFNGFVLLKYYYCTIWRINIALFEGLPVSYLAWANIILCSFLPLFFLVNAGPKLSS